jgi:hypothetical protein
MQRSVRLLFRSAGLVAAPITGIVLFLSVVGSYSPDLSLLLLFLFAFVGIIVIAILLFSLILALRKRQWQRVLSVFAGLALAAVLAFPAWLAGDYIHFAALYLQRTDIFAKAGARPFFFYWNSNGFAGISCERYLVRDPAGPAGKIPGNGVVERRLTSSFYILTNCN